MSLDNIISEAVAKAVKELYGVDAAPSSITPQTTRKDFEGNLTIVVFPWVKAARKAPEAVGKEIGDWLVENEPAVDRYNVVKGFLNLVIEPTFWSSVLQHILETKDYGTVKSTEESPLVMIEYSSPNTNKPLHLGHVRNILLGDSLSRILGACGNRVVRTNIVNDRGIHICKSMLAWQKWGDGVTPEKAGKKGDHLIGDFYVLFDKHFKTEVKELMEKGMSEDEAKNASPLMAEAREMLRRWEAKDPEIRSLWEMMNSWVYAGFDETYDRMGVGFDKIYYESSTYLKGKEKVLEGLEKGLMYRKDDGSVWADLTSEGLDHKLLLRSDGTSVYMTQDIGTAQMRFADYPIDRKQAQELSMTEYGLLAGLRAMSIDGHITAFFSIEELNALWACNNLKQYLQRTASSLSTLPASIASKLLDNLITTTDDFIAGRNDSIKVMLRFGHAETMMPLLSLMRLPGCYYVTDDMESVAQHWHNFHVVPMASNLQIIVFRSTSGRYYVRFDLNECPVPLLPDDSRIYIPWDEAKARLNYCLTGQE